MTSRNEDGFTLIEALIAMMILSFGLMSLAIMSNRSVLYADNAATQSQGVELVYDLADRIRANRDGRTSYVTSFDDAVTASNDCSSTRCSAAQIAQVDLADWKRRLADTLPAGEGEVSVIGDDLSISIRWRLRQETLAYDVTIRG